MRKREPSLIAKHFIAKARAHKEQQRLQFPVINQQRKHFQRGVGDQVSLGSEEEYNFKKNAKHNKLDVTDIEGAQPCFVYRSRSQKYLSPAYLKGHFNELSKDILRRQMSLNNLVQPTNYNEKIAQKLNMQAKGIGETPQESKNIRHKEKHSQLIKTEPDDSSSDNLYEKYRLVQLQRPRPNPENGKHRLLRSPTYLSALFFA